MIDKKGIDVSLKPGTKDTWIVRPGLGGTRLAKTFTALRYEIVDLEQQGYHLTSEARTRMDARLAELTARADQAGERERYAKKVTLYAKLPDGEIIDRTTDHPYQFVIAVRRKPEDSRKGAWGYTRWSKTAKAAEAARRQYVGWNAWAEVRIVPVFATEAEARAAEI